MVVGDLNAKIKENEEGNVEALSPNGILLKEIIDENILEVVNFSSKCMGKWTLEIRTSKRRSVLDYIIVDKNMLEDIEELLIDEECLITPFRLKKMKDATTQVFSDHNAMLLKLDTNALKRKLITTKKKNMRWD